MPHIVSRQPAPPCLFSKSHSPPRLPGRNSPPPELSSIILGREGSLCQAASMAETRIAVQQDVDDLVLREAGNGVRLIALGTVRHGAKVALYPVSWSGPFDAPEAERDD